MRKKPKTAGRKPERLVITEDPAIALQRMFRPKNNRKSARSKSAEGERNGTGPKKPR